MQRVRPLVGVVQPDLRLLAALRPAIKAPSVDPGGGYSSGTSIVPDGHGGAPIAQPSSAMSFERLRVYQAAERLDAEVHVLIARLPPGFSRDIDQLRRAAGSVLYNIAQAYGSEQPGRKRNHLEIARGSVDETRAILRRLANRGGLEPAAITKATALTVTIAKMLTSWSATLPP